MVLYNAITSTKEHNVASCTEHIQTLGVQPAHTCQDLSRRYCSAAADCGSSLCCLRGGRPTAQHSVVIWKIPQPVAVNLIFFSSLFFPHVTTDSQLLLWEQTQSTVSLSANRHGQAGGEAERSELFTQGVLIWGWIYTLIEYQGSLWCRSDLFMSIWRRLSRIINNYRWLYYVVIVRWG